MDSPGNLYDDLDRTNVSKDDGSQNASAQDFNLFEDCIISKENEKEAKKFAELTEKYEYAVKENCSLKQSFSLLEEDAKTLMRNISSLWKTAVAQLQKKDKQIIALQKEKEGIIFRRAMRQIPKDELDRVVSRIAAYDKSDFVEFMKSLNSGRECREIPSSSFPKVKYKSDQVIKKCVLGARVNEKRHLEALRLHKLQGRAVDMQRTQETAKLSENKFSEEQDSMFGEKKTNEENGTRDPKMLKSSENETNKRKRQSAPKLENEIEGAKIDAIKTNDKETGMEMAPALHMTDGERELNENIGSNECLSEASELEEGECSEDSCNLEGEQFSTSKRKAGEDMKEKEECRRKSKRQNIGRGQKAEQGEFNSQSSNTVKESSTETTDQARCQDIRSYRIPKMKKPCDEKENKGKDYQKPKSISTVNKKESRSQSKTLAERNLKDRPEQRASSRESPRDAAHARSRRSTREKSSSNERRSRTHSHDDKKSPHGRTEDRRSSPRKWCRETRNLVERLRENYIREGMSKRSYSRQPHLSVYARRRRRREMEKSRKGKYESPKRRAQPYSLTYRDRSDQHLGSSSSAMPNRTSKGKGSRESSGSRRPEASRDQRDSKEARKKRSKEMKEDKIDEKSTEQRIVRKNEEYREFKLQRTENDPKKQRISEEVNKQRMVESKRQRLEEPESSQVERNPERSTEHLKMTEATNSVPRRSKSLERDETSSSKETAKGLENNSQKRVRSNVRETRRKKRSCNSEAAAKVISLGNLPPLSDAQFRLISDILNAAKGANTNLDAKKNPLSLHDLPVENVNKLSREVEEERILIQGLSPSQRPLLSLQEPRSVVQESSDIQRLSTNGLSTVQQESSAGDTCLKPTFKGVLNLPESKIYNKTYGSFTSNSCTNRDSNTAQADEGDTLDFYIQKIGVQNSESLTLQYDDSEMSLLRFLEKKPRSSPNKSSTFIAISPPPFVMPTVNSPIKTFHNHPSLALSSGPRTADILQENSSDQTAAVNPPRPDHLSPICMLPMQNNFTVPTPPSGRLPYSLKILQDMETPIKNLSTASCSPIPVATPLDAANNLTATSTPPQLSSTLKSSTPVVVFDLDKKCSIRHLLPPLVHQKIVDRNSLFSIKEIPESVSDIQSSIKPDQTTKRPQYSSGTEMINSNREQRQREDPLITSVISSNCDTSQESIYGKDKSTEKKKVAFFTISKEVSRRGNLVPNSDEYKACGFASSFYKNLDEFEQDWPSRTKYTHSRQNEKNQESNSIGEKSSVANSKTSPTSTTTSSNHTNSNSCSSSSSSSSSSNSTGSSSSDSSSSRSCSTCSSSTSRSSTENKTVPSSDKCSFQTSFSNTISKSIKNGLSEALSGTKNSSPLKQRHSDRYTNDSVKPSPMKSAALKCLVKTSVKKSPLQSSQAKRVQSSPTKRVQASPKKGVQSSPTKRVQSSPKKGVQSSPTKRVQASPKKGVQSISMKKAQSSLLKKGQSSPTKKVQIVSMKALMQSSPLKIASTRRTPVKESPITKSSPVRSSTKSSLVRKGSNKSSSAKISPPKTSSMKKHSPKVRSPNSKTSSSNAGNLKKSTSISRPEKSEEISSPIRRSARIETSKIKSVKDEKMKLDKSSDKIIKPSLLASNTGNAVSSADISSGSDVGRDDETIPQFSKSLCCETALEQSSESKEYQEVPCYGITYAPDSIATSLQNQTGEIVSESNSKEISQSMVRSISLSCTSSTNEKSLDRSKEISDADSEQISRSLNRSTLSQSSDTSLDISSSIEKSLDKSKEISDTASESEDEQVECEHAGNMSPGSHSPASEVRTAKSKADSNLEASSETSKANSSNISSVNSSASREMIEECNRTSTIQSTGNVSCSNVPSVTPPQNRTSRTVEVTTPEGVSYVKTVAARTIGPATPCNIISVVYSGEEEMPECTKEECEDIVDESSVYSKRRRSPRKRKSPTASTTKPLKDFQADCPGSSFQADCPGSSFQADCPGSSFQADCPGSSFQANCPGSSFQADCPSSSQADCPGSSSEKTLSHFPKNKESISPLASQVIIKPIKRRKVNLTATTTSASMK